jgi:hypothetical protein
MRYEIKNSRTRAVGPFEQKNTRLLCHSTNYVSKCFIGLSSDLND